ncbi:MAG: DNA-deoxyinosine glycosylase [Bacillota bacterium]|nr:DNA-deoxyinosine glycosylase [Bacillota bacterium]
MVTKNQVDDRQPVCHPFEPVCNASSRILILGTMPSVLSRQNRFYYGHPQNRFWPLLARLFHACIPQTIEEKTALILAHNLALWDVLQQCRIQGSADSTIQDVVANPIDQLLVRCPIKAIFANGQTAGILYRRHIEPFTQMPITILPSTSPANARFSLEDLAVQWHIIQTV